MILLFASIALAAPGAATFPERTPGLMAARLAQAVESREVRTTVDSHR